MGLEKRLVVFGRLPRESAEPDSGLHDLGFQVYAVESESELLDVVQFSQPDGVLLMGHMSISTIMRLLATSQNSGRSLIGVICPGIAPSEAVDLLDKGVDYVASSYQPEWVAAQVRAVLRRIGRDRLAPSVIELGHLHIDLQQRRVTVQGRQVALTPTEFSVLRVLAERPGTVLPSGEIMQQVMGVRIPESEAQDILKVHIHRLRQKLETNEDRHRVIRTVRGHGYMYAFERRSRDRTQALSDTDDAPLTRSLQSPSG